MKNFYDKIIKNNKFKSQDERLAEKEERDQLAHFHDVLVQPEPKLSTALHQIRSFHQQLFEGFLNRQIPPSMIQGTDFYISFH